MPRYDFVSPGAAAGDAITRQLLLREQLRRDQLREALELERFESDKASQAEERAARAEQRDFQRQQLGIQRNRAGIEEMNAAAEAAMRQQEFARTEEDRRRRLMEAADLEAKRQMVGGMGPGEGQQTMTPERAQEIANAAYASGLPVPPGVVAFLPQPPKPEEAYTLGPGEVRVGPGGRRIAEGLPRAQPSGPAPDYNTVRDPRTGRQRQVAKGEETNRYLDAGWEMKESGEQPPPSGEGSSYDPNNPPRNSVSSKEVRDLAREEGVTPAEIRRRLREEDPRIIFGH